MEGSVPTAVHYIWIGTMLQQYSGTFFFLALYGLLLLHQEIDSLVQNKHILGFTYCYIQMKLISFCPKHLNPSQFDLLVAMYLNECCAVLTVTGINLTFSLY